MSLVLSRCLSKRLNVFNRTCFDEVMLTNVSVLSIHYDACSVPYQVFMEAGEW